MIPVQHVKSLRVAGGSLAVRWHHRTPEAVEALRQLKPGLLLLDRAARMAGCTEPLVVLAHEFRLDLQLLTDGAFSVEVVATAIEHVGLGHGWQFERRWSA